MEADAVHHLVHDEGRAPCNARILHERYTEEEDGILEQEDYHAAHTAYDTVGDKVFEHTPAGMSLSTTPAIHSTTVSIHSMG